ncbi:MAG: DUF2066 domain-containing protein [Pseudomonadales bacterium]
MAQPELDAVEPEDAFATELQEPELGPYEARIVVESQSELVRLRAMSEGLQQVIVNLLGNEDALYEPEISRALRAPQQYVLQFSYEKGYSDEEDGSDEEDASDEEDLSKEDDNERQLQTFLKLHFLQRRVDDLLRAANQIEVGELQSIDIEVQGIVDFSDYASTLTALQKLVMVRDVSPVLVQAERVEFSLQFEGDIERFTSAVEEQTRLRTLDYGIDPLFADRLSYELGAEEITQDD